MKSNGGLKQGDKVLSTRDNNKGISVCIVMDDGGVDDDTANTDNYHRVLR